jgi:DNA-binding NarL/FixJ family response regulator
VVRCRVEDRGPGIPADRREAVFEPFLRGDGDGKPPREGAGLGLAICRRLVGLMGGSLWLDPQERGCRFTFTAVLPATERPEAPPEALKSALAVQGRILVADDSEFGRDAAAAMAAGTGVTVDVAEDGVRAVEKAAGQRYDLILLDQRMPGLDGPAALAAIRADEARRGAAPVPVVAMTAGIPGKSGDDYLAEGFDDHLAKPFSAQLLAELLARHLPAAPAAAPQPGQQPGITAESAAAVAACRADFPQLAAATAQNDREGAAYFAHRIKGVGMLAGLSAIARAAEAVEEAATAGNAPLAPLVEALEQTLAAEDRRPGRQRNSRRPDGPIRALLVDDHEMVRDGLRTALAGQPDFEVVGEAADGLDCIRMVVRHHPDLVLIDLVMPRMNGAEAIPEIRKRLPAARIVVLTGAVSPALLRAAADGGADALVRKDVSTEELLRTLRSVMVGKPPPVQTAAPAGEPPVALTRRERQVLQMIVEGRRTRDIADLLALSERTVEKYRASLGHKLGTSTPAELAALAVRHGLTAEA